MTSNERLLAAFRGRDVDHVPCCPAFWTGTPANQAFTWATIDKQLDYVLNTLGADARLSFAIDSPWPVQKLRTEERTGEPYQILHSAIQTEQGEIRATVKKTDDYPHPDIPVFSDWTVSRFVKPWIQTQEDVDVLASFYLPPSDTDLSSARERLVGLEATAGKWQVPIIGQAGFALNGAIHSMGAEPGVLIGVDSPGVIESFLEVIYRRQETMLDMMLDLGVTTVIRNGWYDSTDFWTPDQFDRWIVPQLRKDIDVVHQAGGIYIYQMCTGIRPLLPSLANLDFDCLLEFEPELGMTDSSEVKQALSGKSFWGGVSAPVHLEGGDEEMVRKAVRHAFEVFGDSGFILKAVPSIRAHLPSVNIDAFFDEWKAIIS